MKALLILLSILFSSTYSLTQSISNNSSIYLLTCSPGEELYNTFGHTAMRVLDQKNNIDVIFNYGIFDFNTPNFYTKFLRGKLLYRLGTSTYENFMANYDHEKRSVYQQKLNCDSIQKQEIFKFLKENYKPENREYKYDFFFDNCSTRQRDIFENVFTGLQYPKLKVDKTFRNILDEYLTEMPWSDFGIDLIIGSKADKITTIEDQMFIPDYLHDHYSKSFDGGKSIIEGEDLVLDNLSYRANKKGGFRFTPLMLFGLLLLFECILLSLRNRFTKAANKYDKFWFFLMGIAGIIILFMWIGTDHQAVKANWNLLWLHPLYLVLPFIWSKHTGIGYILKLLCFVLLCISLIGGFMIPQQFHIAFTPIILIAGVKLFNNLFRTPKVIQKV